MRLGKRSPVWSDRAGLREDRLVGANAKGA